MGAGLAVCKQTNWMEGRAQRAAAGKRAGGGIQKEGCTEKLVRGARRVVRSRAVTATERELVDIAVAETT